MGVKVKEWKGAWWVFVNHNGRRKAKRCASKKAAHVIADKIDAALKLGQVGILDERPAGPTFEGLAYEWLKVYPVTRSVSRTTMENYESFTLRHLLPFFGPMRVAEITHKTVEAFVAEKRGPSGSLRMKGKPLAEQSLRVGLVALRLVLNRAVKDGFLPSNPAVGVVRFTRTDEQTGDPFTGEELRGVLAAATRITPTFAIIFCDSGLSRKAAHFIAASCSVESAKITTSSPPTTELVVPPDPLGIVAKFTSKSG